jgi:NADPH:quinone reductase-like Zn-dependent oxidoreductase
MSLPATQEQWVNERVTTDSFDGLIYQADAPLPKVGDTEVLVKLSGASLNFRDLIIPRVTHSLPLLQQPTPH